MNSVWCLFSHLRRGSAAGNCSPAGQLQGRPLYLTELEMALYMFITMIKKHTHLVLLFRRASSLYLHNIHRPLANRTFFNGHQMLVPLGDPVHWGPMNKQMSLAAGLGSPCPMSGGGGKLYSEVQCIMGNGHMGILTLWTEWQTDTCENITLMQFRGRA